MGLAIYRHAHGRHGHDHDWHIDLNGHSGKQWHSVGGSDKPETARTGQAIGRNQSGVYFTSSPCAYDCRHHSTRFTATGTG
ncbi:protein of unknown function [Shewanella benthica]|uniref:Uncharacterized protein n=1 Tax=Shewanella benthica TaxID=43661 RepID=A0A330MBG8_9GAMM|nr:protein of unknown function [Shewanella benthica]